ncbi:methyltransferase domain-containing protein [Clostridium sp. CS001]|uniref:class I SAM-dependent methyltransferase n=1 Tax=Clostridium sp. CS001 TaxID=2880648 RepID=UPI001CF1DEAA|nr:class I SAM-dependent methyltransferase [Clostridium sp. CS001]MCB2288651.1 methyltransferase domain-containing protein [Clostridium sp. CS001]
MTKELEKYYNKFCEDKRLMRKYGQVEYITSMKYIHEYLENNKSKKVLDVGAGTGRYSVQLSNEGYDVTAIELVKHNLGILKSKGSAVKAMQGTALDLSRFSENTFDMTLVFGPMYHLYKFEDKVKVLQEAKRVTKPDGIILVAYCMNEFSVITYGFKENNVRACIDNGKLTADFHVVSEPEDLYDYVRTEDINKLNMEAKLKRVKLIAADGPANYMRSVINDMDEDTFGLFLDYHFSTCERPDLLGASGHTVDILRKEKED